MIVIVTTRNGFNEFLFVRNATRNGQRWSMDSGQKHAYADDSCVFRLNELITRFVISPNCSSFVLLLPSMYIKTKQWRVGGFTPFSWLPQNCEFDEIRHWMLTDSTFKKKTTWKYELMAKSFIYFFCLEWTLVELNSMNKKNMDKNVQTNWFLSRCWEIGKQNDKWIIPLIIMS